MSIKKTLDTYLYKYTGGHPKYRAFLQAQNIDFEEMKKETLFDLVMKQHGDRIDSYQYYWNMYLGKHWFNKNNINNTVEPVTANYVGKAVNKHARFLMNKGFLVESDFPEVEKFLQNNWKLNNGGVDHNLFGIQVATQTGITGDTWVDMKYTEDEELQAKYIKYDILDSMSCFPVIDRGKQIGFLYYKEEQQVDSERFGFTDYSRVWEGFYLKPGSRSYIRDAAVYNTVEYDLLSMPLVHFTNFKLPTYYYGISDILSVDELNILLDRLITDIQDVVDYQASPVTILKGAYADDLVRASNKIWSIPKDADIKNLELDGELTAMVTQLQRLRTILAEMSDVPEYSLGKELSISNTSAAALAILFLPLYEVMDLKRIMYSPSILEINRFTIKMAILKKLISPNRIIKDALSNWKKNFGSASEEVKQRNYPFDWNNKPSLSEDYDTVSAFYSGKIPKEIFDTYITWYPPLPRDEKGLSDLAIANVNSDMWSRRHARSVIGMSEIESDLMDVEIEAEKKIYGETMTVTDKNTKGKTGLENNTDVKGEKTSKKAEQNK